MTTCSNCNREFSDNYCGHCGQAAKLKRIDRKYVLHEITHVLHLEKGIFYTIKELFVRPGASVRNFISDDRSRLVKPVIFIIVTSVIYTICSHWVHQEEGNYTPVEKNMLSDLKVVFDWIQHHYGYANIIQGVFITLWLKLFFRNYAYNFFEILILLCFVMGIGMLLLAFFCIIEAISGLHLARIAELTSIIYCSWAIGQFFDKSKFGSYLKALGAYLMGMISYFILVAILCVAVILIKH
jgi:hypothetical protein